MFAIGWSLLLLGLTVGVYWRLRFLALAYNRSRWWLAGCLSLPLANWIFLFQNWKTAFKPFGLSMLWLLLAGMGGCVVEFTWHS